jgi:hypothetical protein
MRPTAFHAYPAWELVPVYSCHEPVNWADRWTAVGGPHVHPTRLIALKSDPVWGALANKEMFADALGNPFPPFADGSGWGWRAVRRDECIALGMNPPEMDLSDVPKPVTPLATLRATRAELNAAYMELTGKSLPEQRPGNDGPGNSCPLCGSDSLNRVRGLQGVKEVLICLVLCLLFLLPGVIYYVYIETVPYCSRCGHRAFKSSHKK